MRSAPRADLAPLLALGLVVLASLGSFPALFLGAGTIVLALGWTKQRPPDLSLRVLFALVAAALLMQVGGAIHARLVATPDPEAAQAAASERLAAVEARAREIVGALQDAADRARDLPETPLALRGDRAALTSLFRFLEKLRSNQEGRPALAIHSRPLATIAWSGRIGDAAVLEGLVGDRPDVFILGGVVSTTLVAVSPVVPRDGALQGWATATLPIAVRRNIRNEFLSDFDLLGGGEPGIELRYVDARGEREGPRPFPEPPPGTVFRDGILRAPDGGVLAAVRALAPDLASARRRAESWYRRGLSFLALLALVTWAARPGRTGIGLRAWLLAAAAYRVVLLGLGWPWPGLDSPLLSPDTYASPLLGPLLANPLDLLFTALVAFLGASVLLELALRHAPRPSAAGVLIATLATPVLIAAALVFVGDIVANCSLDLESLPLVPRSPSQVALQASVALILTTGLLSAVAVLVGSGVTRFDKGRHAAAAVALLVAAAVAALFWPSPLMAPPPLPFVLVLGSVLALSWTAPRVRRLWESASLGTRAGAGLGFLAGLGLVAYPSLLHFSQRNVRAQVARSHAPLVLRQPQWREYVLESARERIDELNLLEDAPPGIYRPGVEELAFAVWSATDLAAFGVSSAVEIQDPTGQVISRFALNLASLAGPDRPLPATEDWDTTRDAVRLASAVRHVLHSRRLLRYHDEIHGAIHVFVAEDFWNLPFVRDRDPYSVLYRNAAQGRFPERVLTLLAYNSNRDLVFSSAERPPALNPALASRAARSPAGFWTVLTVDGVRHHAFVFGSADSVFALSYPAASFGQHLGNLVEAAASLVLFGLAVLFLVVVARSLLRRPSLSLWSMADSLGRRFALRLFVAFTVLAVVPAAVLQVVVSGFLASRLRKEADNQALERASVAKKAVEDYAFFQREEAPSAQPVRDPALVWLASVLKNDLEVFEGGRLLATSKRELYTSGLLAPRISGAVYRELTLEGQQTSLRNEKIGLFAYQVASVPVHVGGPAPGILAMPLALRQREVEATVADLDRSIRLASVVFLALGAILAHSLARRISGPISDLTEATRRIARGDLEARVEAGSRDELRRLVEAFNQMARDLEGQRRDLERSNRLAAWADMARQVAHEVKNPLTPIQLSAEHLRRVFENGDADFAATLDTCTTTILKEVRKLREIVTEFSAFARPPVGILETADPAELLAEVVRPYRAGLPPGVQLDLDLDGGAPTVRVDRRLLERAIVNLVENALQAVGERGTIRVSLRSPEGGRRVEVEVLDSGPGIPPEVRDRVFEPFFSTKTSGSGLGLALVKKIAEDHGGGVSLESTEGRPTRAVLWIPADPDGTLEG